MRSLRTSIVAGTAALSLLVVGGLAALVYARARALAHGETAERLRLHARVISGLLEVGKDGVEFEAAGAPPEYRASDGGAWAEILDGTGKVVVRSPSLGDRGIPGGDAVAVREEEFSPRQDPPGAPLRYRVRVALDTTERDRSLAGLAWFLGGSGAAILALSLGAGLLLARRVLRPIRRMTQEAATLDPADPERRLHPSRVVEELHSLASTLNAALDRLGAALERQRRFTSDASHELRTPVSVLLAGTEHLLRRPRTAEEYREGFERQLRTVRRMKEITENLLVLARADAEAGGMAREPVDLAEVLEGACEEFQPLAEEKGLRLVREGGGEVPVSGDRRFLAQFAANLLSNAVKFTPAGGAVTAAVAREDGHAVLTVRDTGPGIPPEHVSHVRERFYRVREGKDAAEGAGLGLAIADWIARSHGGEMTVASRPGEGSTFGLRVPLRA